MKTLALVALIATVTPKVLDTCPPEEDGGCQRYKNHPTVCAQWGEDDKKVKGCILPSKCGARFMDTNYYLNCLEELSAMANLVVSAAIAVAATSYIM